MSKEQSSMDLEAVLRATRLDVESLFSRLEKLEAIASRRAGSLDDGIWDSADMEKVRQFLTDRLKSIGDYFPLDIARGETRDGKIVFHVTCHVTEPTLRKVTGENKRLKQEDEA